MNPAFVFCVTYKDTGPFGVVNTRTGCVDEVMSWKSGLNWLNCTVACPFCSVDVPTNVINASGELTAVTTTLALAAFFKTVSKLPCVINVPSAATLHGSLAVLMAPTVIKLWPFIVKSPFMERAENVGEPPAAKFEAVSTAPGIGSVATCAVGDQ